MTALIDRLRLFSVREFAVHPGRTVASIAVMAVSALYLVAVFGIFGSITGSVDRLSGGLAGKAALEVSGITDGGFPDSVRAEVAAVPGVRVAAPMLRTSVSTASGRVLLLGATGDSAELDSDLKDPVAGQLGSVFGVTDPVLVGPGVPHAKGERFQLGSGLVTVAMVLHGKELADLNGGHYVLAPLPLAQRIAGRPGQLDSILITLAPGVDLATVRAAVTAAVNGRAVVADPGMRAAQTGDAVKLMNFMALMGAAVAFVVGAFLIYTTVTMAITQRRPVVSMLRAVGGRRGTLVRDLVAEAAVLGLVGGAIGSAFGIVVGHLAIGRLPTAITHEIEARLEYSLPWYGIPIALAVTMVTSMAATVVAARQVYRVSPIEALAPVGASRADVASRRLRVVSGVGAVFVLVVSVMLVVAHRGVIAFAAMSALFCVEIALGFALTETVVRATASTARAFGKAGALASATVERAPRRVWATVMTVFIAVITTVGITGTDNDMIRSAGQLFSPVGEADAWVSTDAPDTFATDVLPQDLTARVAAVPGVQRVVQGQLAFAAVGGTRVMLDGMSADTDDAFYRALDHSARADLLAGRGVALSRNLGSSLGVHVGDELSLQTPTGVRLVPVLRLVPYFSTVIGTIGIDLGHMQQWFNRPGASTLQITAAPGVDRGRLLADIRRVVPAQDYVYDGQTALAGAEAPMRQSMLIANAVWIIVAFVAAVALMNTLTMSVLERRREIGVLRAMGANRRLTLWTVLAEAAGIGLVGGIAGLVLGVANQRLISVVTPDIMNFEVTFRPSPMAVVFAGSAVALTLLGAMPPALRAARLNIIDAVSVD